MAAGAKFDYILDCIDAAEGDQILIFVRTKANAQKLAEALLEEDIAAKALEGNMDNEIEIRLCAVLKMVLHKY